MTIGLLTRLRCQVARDLAIMIDCSLAKFGLSWFARRASISLLAVARLRVEVLRRVLLLRFGGGRGAMPI